MKVKKIAAVIAAIVFPVSLAFADDAHHPGNTPVSGEVTSSQTQPTDAGVSAMPMMPIMQEKMKAMQAQMSRLQHAKGPQEKRKLMAEHMLSMQEEMKMMEGMMGGNMMMGSAKAGGTMPPQMMEERIRTMEQRVDLVQQMLEQMLQQQDAAAQLR